MDLSTKKYKKIWMYFKRGHSQFFVYIMSFLNFLGVIFLVIEKIFGVNLYVVFFFILFVLGYPILGTGFGIWDYSRRGIFPVEAEVWAKSHPYFRDLAEAHAHPERAKEILGKWYQ